MVAADQFVPPDVRRDDASSAGDEGNDRGVDELRGQGTHIPELDEDVRGAASAGVAHRGVDRDVVALEGRGIAELDVHRNQIREWQEKVRVGKNQGAGVVLELQRRVGVEGHRPAGEVRQ